MDPHKTERPSPAFDNLLITRDLTERSARFYTEENLGRRVHTEPDILFGIFSFTEARRLMRKILALLLILLLPGLLRAKTITTSPSLPLVLTHVTVINGTSGRAKSGM